MDQHHQIRILQPIGSPLAKELAALLAAKGHDFALCGIRTSHKTPGHELVYLTIQKGQIL